MIFEQEKNASMVFEMVWGLKEIKEPMFSHSSLFCYANPALLLPLSYKLQHLSLDPLNKELFSSSRSRSSPQGYGHEGTRAQSHERRCPRTESWGWHRGRA